MKKATRRLGLTLGGVLLFVLLLVMAVALLVQSPWMRGWIEDQASEQVGRKVEIGDLNVGWGWPLSAQVSDVRVANVDRANEPDMARLAEAEITLNPGGLFRGELELEHVRIKRPEIYLARREDGTTNWDDLLDEMAPDEDADEGPPVWPASFTVGQGLLTYRDPALGIALDVTFQTPGESVDELRLELQGEGQLQDDPVQFQALASYHSMEQRGTVEALEGQIGESQLSGELAVDFERDVPFLMARLNADELDLNRWGLMEDAPQTEEDALPPEQAPSPGEEPHENVAERLEALERQLAEALEVLQEYEAQLDLSIDRLIYADQTLSDVALVAALEDGRLTLEQLRAIQQNDDEGQGELNAQGWIEVQDQRLAMELDARFDQIDLTAALAPLGLGDMGTLDGQLNTQMIEGELVLDDTAIDYQAPALGLALSLQANSHDIEGFDRPGVHLVGEATYRQESFTFDLVVGPLSVLIEDETPYPVTGELSLGETRLSLNLSIVQPLELAAVEGDVRVEGPTPAELSALVDFEIPEFPEYQLYTQLSYEGDLLQLQALEGSIGGSDVAGDVRVRFGERTMLWATLTSEVFDFDDFVLETIEEEAEEHPGVFSNDPWEVDALRGMDAEVDYTAANVQAGYVPLSNVSLALALEQGELTLEPLEVGLGGGLVTTWLTLDSQQDALMGDLRINIDQVNLRPLLRDAGLPEVAKDSLGIIGGRSELSFSGRSMAEVMGGLDGTLQLAMAQGWLDLIAAELLPLNVADALVAALTDGGQIELQCTYVRLVADDGLVTLDEFFMATESAHLTAAGVMNLATEEMEFAFEGHNKDVTIFTANSPVELEGSMDDPEVNVVSPELLARGLASVLGALVAPPAAILPWIDLGGGDDVGMGCERALEEFPDN